MLKDSTFIASPMLEIEIELDWLPMEPFLAYMYGTHLIIGKPFVRKQYNVLIFLTVSAKSMEVLIELSEDCCCNLSLPISNEQTLGNYYLRLTTAKFKD